MPSFSGIPGAGKFSHSKLMQVYRRGLGAYYFKWLQTKGISQRLGDGSREIFCHWPWWCAEG